MVPEGWEETVLARVARITMGQSPPSSDITDSPLGFPFVQGNAQFGVVSPTPEGWVVDPPRTAIGGSILMSVRAPVGALNRIDEPYAIGRGLCAILPKEGRSTRGFLLETLATSTAYLESRAQGSTFTAVNKADVHDLPLLLPPLPEQKKIAAILSTVDDAIAATRKVIEQTEQVKKGLLQTLMTRGIGHTRFKKTEIGEIPEGWDVVPLAQVSEHITKGATPTTYGFEWVEDGAGGVPFFRSECVSERGFQLARAARITPEAHRQMQRSEVKSGDILVTITGNVGRIARVPLSIEKANINQHIARVRVSDPRLDPDFVELALRTNGQRRRFETITTGLAYPQLSLRQVQETQIPLPSMSEQKQIRDVVGSVTGLVRNGLSRESSLLTLKRGLLQDLITGRVRVTPD